MSYTVDLEGQTGKLTSSTLPAVRRWAAEGGTLNVHATGTEHTLKAGGTVGKSFSVLTDWRLGDILTLNGAAIVRAQKCRRKSRRMLSVLPCRRSAVRSGSVRWPLPVRITSSLPH